ncbi:MAG: PfaD family polyunsaturated fatty acid/polyketide biosynthesis protein [Gammaproteobacteria bacterium]|nr:PfaD family polyunsaturated fatty acid/polyketide biosynthesis protein [Gammaproteobacteria bacterium]
MNTAHQEKSLITLIQDVRRPLYILQHQSGYRWPHTDAIDNQEWRTIGLLPALYPEWLGSQDFTRAHNVQFPYVTGAMANGIATAEIVIAMAKANMLGFFGAAGLVPERIEQALQKITQALATTPSATWGSNLIHMPNEPGLEKQVVELYIRYKVQRISASAFMQVNANIVRLACHGLTQDSQGKIIRQHHIFAKISQPNLAKQFMSPPPIEIVNELVQCGELTPQEAKLSQYIPLAQDITAESDSGGHTDNRPLTALFPVILQLREKLSQQYHYSSPIRIGAAGGIGTPEAAAAAFAMGADYIMTGSINQAAIESGLSENGKQLLTQADLTDVIMAPAADMFEQGVKLQVLKRGTLFAMHAVRLYEWYKKYNSIDELPQKIKLKLEKDILQTSIETIWQQTYDYFMQRDAKTLADIDTNPKKKMALIFRWYLGNASRWAIQGETERQADYQIWCGPAMGAFNHWVQDSYLEPLPQRQVVQIALNILEGAAVVTRSQQLRTFGVKINPGCFDFKPIKLKTN